MNYESKKTKISVIYLVGGTYDKEIFKKSLESCDWADEVVKIDTDKLKTSFSSLRNLGAKEAKSEWLLYVDTDEIITPELKKVLTNSTKSSKYAAYAIPRRNIVLGREMKHCGLWPDYVIRLIRKNDLIGWEGDLHEQPRIKGKVFHLNEPLIHQKHDNLTDMVTKTNMWSEIEAKLMFKANHPKMNFFRFASAGFREFWLRMIMQTAFLDGVEGTIYGLYQVFSRLISYSKLWELQLKNASGNI